MAKLSKFSLNFGLTEGTDEPLGGRQVSYGTEIHHDTSIYYVDMRRMVHRYIITRLYIT